MANNPAGLENLVESTPDSQLMTAAFLRLWTVPDLVNNFASVREVTVRPEGGFDKNATSWWWSLLPQLGGLYDSSSFRGEMSYHIENADGTKPTDKEVFAPIPGAPLTFWKGITFSSGNTTIEGSTETAYMKNYVQLLLTGKRWWRRIEN